MRLSRLKQYFDSRFCQISSLNEQQHTWDKVGRNRYPILTVDNFFKYPEKVARAAHNLEYSMPTGKHIHSSASLSLRTEPLYRYILEQYGSMLGLNSPVQIRAKPNSWQFHRSLPFNTNADLPILREDPHADTLFLIAGIIYLTPDKYCQGGTGFFRYKPNDAEEKPPSPSWFLQKGVSSSVVKKMTDYGVYRAYKDSGYSSYSKYVNSISGKAKENRYHLHNSDESWALNKLIKMKFNRLVLYPAFILHKAIYEASDFDLPIQYRRLTQNVFFKYPLTEDAKK